MASMLRGGGGGAGGMLGGMGGGGFPAPGLPGGAAPTTPASPTSATGTGPTSPPINPFNMFGGSTGIPGAGVGASANTGAANANPFGMDPALMQQLLGGGMGGGLGGLGGFGAPAAPADSRPPEERFQVQLQVSCSPFTLWSFALLTHSCSNYRIWASRTRRRMFALFWQLAVMFILPSSTSLVAVDCNQ